jgi:release factor glutamine methyltransferase
MTARDLLHEAARKFELSGIPSPRLDAEMLLAFCQGCDRLEFFKNPTLAIGEIAQTQFQKLTERRLQGEPVAYIIGRKEFWSLVLEVNNAVLIPRPDTEVLVEEALQVCKQVDSAPIRILDIGTGSGAIALALAKELPRAQITATEISATALAVAKKNAHNLGLQSQIDFRLGNLFKPVGDFFDIIVSNPPYIAAEDYDQLPPGVKNYEPREALFAGADGLDFFEKIISQSPGYLGEKGWLLLEIGARQGTRLAEMLEAAGYYGDISIRNDYAGLPRVIKARRKV